MKIQQLLERKVATLEAKKAKKIEARDKINKEITAIDKDLNHLSNLKKKQLQIQAMQDELDQEINSYN